jgi:hypothetical protein
MGETLDKKLLKERERERLCEIQNRDVINEIHQTQQDKKEKKRSVIEWKRRDSG